jgi:ABC-type branched-subunit amino acid transport system substrate-binding protein
MPAYAATQAILAAVSKAIDTAGGKMPTRDQVRSEIAKTKGLSTVLGSLTFDKNGDNSQQVIAEYASLTVDSSHKFIDTNTAKTVGWSFIQQKNYSS